MSDAAKISTAEKTAKSAQSKSKQRVANHGEVFTAEREVNAMLDLLPDPIWQGRQSIGKSFLEPACGTGNFFGRDFKPKTKYRLKKRPNQQKPKISQIFPRAL
ncbi:MAG: hypothetical protein Q4B81_03680 [Moraxella sp.]|nr:hypothetical protein [Moraxella sp.]